MVLSSPLNPPALKADPAIERFVTEAENNPPSPEKVAAAKSRYQQQLMLECFSFERLDWLIGRLTGLIRGNAGVIQVAGEGDILDVRQHATADICTVGEKFKRQLQGMFTDENQPVADTAILDRLSKASKYFQEKFAAILSPWLDAFSVETDNKEIRKKINDTAKLLKEETAAKLAAIESLQDGFSSERYLRALSTAAMDTKERKPKAKTVLYSESDVGHPDLFEMLREWRKQKAADEGLAHFQVLHQKTLVQIAIHLPDTLAALKKIQGIGPRLSEKYGRELTTLVADYRREHKIEAVSLPEPAAPEAPPPKPKSEPGKKEDTKKISLALFEQGMSIPEIAVHRNLAVVTIESHLAHFVASGELPIGPNAGG